MFASLVYEVAWVRAFSPIFGTTFYSMSAVLTSFLIGIALGSYYLGKKINRIKNPLKLFVKLELILGIYAILIIFIIKLTNYSYSFLYNAFGYSFLLVISLFILSFIILVIPTTIIGATFPLMSKIYIKNIGKDISDIYAIDTIFAGFGALFAGFIFLPLFGLIQTIILAAIINFGIAYALSKKPEKEHRETEHKENHEKTVEYLVKEVQKTEAREEKTATALIEEVQETRIEGENNEKI